MSASNVLTVFQSKFLACLWYDINITSRNRRDIMNIELIAYTQGNPLLEKYKDIKPAELCAIAAAQCYQSAPKAATVSGCIRRGHESVIEHANFTFLVEGISRACLAQWTRHRLMSYSVKSQRYCRENEINVVRPDTVDEGDSLWEEAIEKAWDTYNRLIQQGVPKQDARYLLPNACCTTMVVTMNARSLRNFLKLRMDNHAQWEIRKAAEIIYDIVMEIAPALFEDLKTS